MHNDVMTRVKTVRGLRMFLTSPLSGGILVCAFTTWIAIIVSVKHVYINALHHGNLADCLFYVYSSFLNSRVIVQILAALIALGCGMLLLNCLRVLKNKILSPIGHFLFSFLQFRFLKF